MIPDLFAPAPVMPSSVLIVCTGNICRSPLAALLLARGLGTPSGLHVASAGLHAVVDADMEQTVKEIALRGGSVPPHRARQLTQAIVDDAGLILTMSLDQRGELVSTFPSALRRTFTLSEFAKLLELNPSSAGSFHDLVEGASASRNRTAIGPDVDDPYRQPRSVHERVALEIQDLSSKITAHLIAASPQP